jgi:hypothetical protein
MKSLWNVISRHLESKTALVARHCIVNSNTFEGSRLVYRDASWLVLCRTVGRAPKDWPVWAKRQVRTRSQRRLLLWGWWRGWSRRQGRSNWLRRTRCTKWGLCVVHIGSAAGHWVTSRRGCRSPGRWLQLNNSEVIPVHSMEAYGKRRCSSTPGRSVLGMRWTWCLVDSRAGLDPCRASSNSSLDVCSVVWPPLPLTHPGATKLSVSPLRVICNGALQTYNAKDVE